MQEQLEYMDVSDTDFLSDKELDDDDSDSDPEIEKYFVFSAAKSRLFGRKRPLHFVLGSGKAADIILWRNKHASGSILGGLTIIWVTFVGMGYTLITFICHSLMLLLTLLFLWANLSSFNNLPPPESFEFSLPASLLVNTALSVRYTLNQALGIIQAIASGQDSKKFLLVAGTLFGLSVGSSFFSVITLFYLVSVILLTVPAMYEKNEDIVDIVAEKALAELHKQYAELKKML